MEIELVNLGRRTDVPRLHMVPGLGGQAIPFVSLARALADVCALQCLQVAPDSDYVYDGDDVDLVQRYVDGLRRSGSGPYRLAGYCVGSYLACAIASRLSDDEVAGPVLAVIRAAVPDDVSLPTHLANTEARLQAVQRQLHLGDLEADGGARDLLRTVDISPDVPAQYALRISGIMLAQVRAVRQVTPLVFHHPVRLVIGAKSRVAAAALRRSWQSILCSRPSVKLILGRAAESWLTPPAVEQLSTAIAGGMRDRR
jgi:thioesterase domain-containing protein